jgi:transposase
MEFALKYKTLFDDDIQRLVDNDEVEDLYCSNNGRPSIDPIVLIKFLLIDFLYGINSERRIAEEIQVNRAYRWFLGLDIMDKTL